MNRRGFKDSQKAVIAHKPGTELVQPITPGICDARMQSRYLNPLVMPAVASLDAPRRNGPSEDQSRADSK